jgi:hypothetical protein
MDTKKFSVFYAVAVAHAAVPLSVAALVLADEDDAWLGRKSVMR